MVEHVIVPLDGSERAAAALGPAAELARRSRAGLTLVRSAHPAEAAEVRADLGRVVVEGGLDPTTEVVVDEDRGPVAAIAAVAASVAEPVVCMTTHGRTGLERVVLGSVAEEALGDSTVPFLLVGPHHDPAVGLGSTVVLAIDGSARSEVVAPMAAAWADGLGLPLWVVSVIEPADLAAAHQASGAEHVNESAHVHRVASALASGLGRTVDWEVLHDRDVASALVAFAAERQALIVMATHGRTGLARAVMGSVTTQVVRDHVGPVLVSRTVEGR
jgi:nucleotide-binding universal stress UspA family protein